jgi:hypothetical protein
MSDLYRKLLGEPPPKEDRDKTFYEIIVPGELLKAQAAFEAGNEARSRVIQLRLDGGACIHCGVEWKPVVVDNLFAAYTYYEPSCTCYLRCWHCGYRVVDEVEGVEERIEFCPNCRVYLWGKRDMPDWKVEEKLNAEAKEK